ncbi:MAG: DUF2817 domain-containing protein [Chloroflexi bacterium]|nr:DUF2817 domain-containing protein [Chloroflexota bacterium]
MGKLSNRMTNDSGVLRKIIAIIGLAVVLVVTLVVGFTQLVDFRGVAGKQAKANTGKTGPSSTARKPSKPVPKAASDGPGWSEIGRTVENRPIKMFKIGTGGKKVLFVAATHGDEYGGEIADRFIDYLIKNKDAIPPDTAVYIVPRVNPDGWEKEKRGNAHRVDINRNFPVRWAKNVDPKDDTGLAGCTAGPKPGSEPETQAIMRLLKRGFTRVISIHSLGGVIDYDGDGHDLAIAMAKASPAYLVDRTQYSGNSSGSFGQYVPKAHNIPVVTIELDSNKLSHVLNAFLVAIKF